MVKTMDKNRELAELMGYQHHTGPIGEGWFLSPATRGLANWKSIDFDTDLNAMAEVEKVIASKSNRHKYAEMVRNRVGAYHEEHLTGTRYTNAWGCLTAPARVRRDIALIVLQEAAKLLKGET
jgi:hypothetical protein